MATNLIAIDPGKRYNAFSTFSHEGLLYSAGYLPVMTFPTMVCETLVVEVPRVYPGGRSPRPNDLIDVAIGAGVALGVVIANEYRQVPPRVWKGTVPKDVMLERILKRLTDTENEVLLKHTCGLPKSKRHNVIDAVGIGLWQLGRL